MTRQTLRSVAAFVVGVLLFAQLAVAAYACPGIASQHGAQTQTQVPAHTMAGCVCDSAEQPVAASDHGAPAMDAQNLNLCAEHCRYGEQGNQASTLTAPAAVLMALYVVPLLPVPPAALPRRAAAAPSALLAATPPHAILHCCLRT